MFKVLLLNASHNDLGLIRALKKMEAYVYVTGNQENLIGQKYADEYIKADYSDKELVLKIAEQIGIDAICPCCNDFGVITAAYVADKMSLPGHDTLDNVLMLHHKNKFKRFAEEIGILTPKAKEFSGIALAREYIQKECRYPIIVKPVDLSAGNGISKAGTLEEAERAVDKAFNASREKVIIIEEFIAGEQQACCTFVKDRKVVACCSNNEYSVVNPYRVEIDTFPAKGFEQVKDFLIEEIERMADALKLADGIFHIQYRIKEDKPYILEAMRRVLGNMYGIPALGVSDFDWDYWEARCHCGLSCDDIPRKVEAKGYYAYRSVMADRNGIVKTVGIDDSIKKYVYDECMLWKSGQVVKNYQSEPLGFYFMKFDSMEEMHKIMIDNYDKVFIYMEDM